MSESKKKPRGSGRVQVRVPGRLEPVYSNFALITNSPSEIIIDLAQIMPQIRQAIVKARVVMTPMNAKLLLRALTDHLSRYEAQFGEIDIPEGTTLADQLFRAPPATNESESDDDG